MTRPPFLRDDEFHALALDITRQLDGLCVAQIEHLLRTVSKMAACTARLDTGSSAFANYATYGRPDDPPKAN
jgi:hypothetical protein